MRPRRLLPLLAFPLLVWSCSDSTSGPAAGEEESATLPDLSGLPVSRSVVEGAPTVCGAPTEVGLMLGPDLTTGSVTVANDEEHLYVTYRSDAGRPILGTALFVGDAPEEIPVTRWGTPRLLRFPYLSGHAWGTQEVTWQVSLDEVNGTEAVIAAFGQIGLLPSWGAGEPITPGRDWAMYFTHPVADCAAEPVGSAGGTVRTPGGEVVFQVPADALTEPVQITIEPATLEEVQARVEEILGGSGEAAVDSAGVEGELALQSLPGEPLPLLGNRIRPIANTFWDFGPDGLQFLRPATVTLTYRDEDIPPGIPEEELGVFIINGVFPFDRIGVVDPIANTITAPVDHFSYFFVGYLEVQATDLTVTGGTAVNDGIPVGTEVSYAATVSNFGPQDVDGVEVLYEITGNVSPGALSEGCTQVADPAPANLAFQCTVGSIAAGNGAGAPAAVFTLEGPGEVVVRSTASFPGVDTNSVNDWFEEAFRVGPVADLAVSTTVSNNGEPVGAEIRVRPSISNFGPESVSGVTVSYEIFGDALPGSLEEGCVQEPDPLFADVLVRCEVGAIPVDDAVQTPEGSFFAQSPGTFQIWVRSSFPGTDPDPDNNLVIYDVTATDPTAEADLTVVSATESADPIEVGLGVTYQATVENLGPQPAPDAVVNYSGFGNVAPGTLGEGCTLRSVPLVADVEVICEVGSLAAGATAQAAPVEFIPGATGEFTVWMTPGSPSTEDPDIDNNRLVETVTVVGRSADLQMMFVSDQDDPVPAGEPVRYNLAVAAEDAAQPVDGAIIRLRHGGDATFVSATVEGCEAIDVLELVECSTPTLPEGLLHELSIFLLPNDGVTQLSVVGEIEAPTGVTDPDDENNSEAEVTTITPATTEGVDLAITTLNASPSQVATGELVQITGILENLGTVSASEVGVAFQAAGSVSIGSLGTGCFSTGSPGDLEVTCLLFAPVPAGGSVATPIVELRPDAPGDYQVQATVVHVDDVDASNNTAVADFSAVSPSADLRLDRFVGTPDVVQVGEAVTYEIDVVADGTQQVAGASVLVSFSGGGADFVSANVSCSTYTTSVVRRCVVPELTPGVPQTLSVTYLMDTEGTTVTAEAELLPPSSLFDDPDLSNNLLTTTTTVESRPPTTLVYGDVVQDILPSGAELRYVFSGTAGDVVRLGVSLVQGISTSASPVVVGPLGDTLVGNEIIPPRADDLVSENLVFTLPSTGGYSITLETTGSGFVRVGLGTGIGRGDFSFGDPDRSYMRVPGTSTSEDYFLDFETVGNEIVVLGGGHLSRFDDLGQFVSGFGSGGEVDITGLLSRRATAFGIQPDGRIVVAAVGGGGPFPWTVARFNADGSLDTGFGTGGTTQVQLGSGAGILDAEPLAVGFQQNGADLDIVVAGQSSSTTERMGIVRLNPDGSVDTGFGTNGIVLASGLDPTTAAIQPDGAILLASASQVRRYSADGSPDLGFGSGGVASFPVAGVHRIIPLAGGDIVGVGDSSEDALVVRLTANGALAAFGSGGAVVLDFGAPGRLQDAVEDAQGRLLLAGYERTPEGFYDQLLVRMSGSGQLDTVFGHGGFLVEGYVDEGRGVAFDPQGRILVGAQGRDAYGLILSRHLVN